MKEEQGAMISHLKKERDEAMHKAVTEAPAEDGAVISSLKRDQAEVQAKIASLVKASPAAPTPKVHRDPASIDDLYNIVSGGASADKQKATVFNARINPNEEGSIVGGYDAYRDNAMSPATQTPTGAVITTNPNDI